MHPLVRTTLVLVGIAGAGYLATRTFFPPRPIEVDAVTASLGTVEDLVTNSEAGSVRTRALARLGAERSGRVVRIPRREGMPVAAGEIVVALDASSALARLEVARRDRKAADASHRVTHANAELELRRLERIEELHRQDLASEESLEEARARHRAADSELSAAEARLESAVSAERLSEDEVAHHVVRAPFNGVVARRLVEVGESVSAGQTVLELADLRRLYVSAPIDERDTGRLHPGLPVRITVDAFPGRSWPGRVTRIASVVDETRDQNRTLEVEAEFLDGADSSVLRPGMTADLEIVLERRDAVLRVPTLAVIEGSRVWTITNGRAVARPIRPGLRNWEWTEVQSGMAAGDPVITSLDRPGLASGVSVRSARARPDSTIAEGLGP